MQETWVPGLGRFPEEGKGCPLLYSGEFHGLYGPWGCKESDTTERVSVMHSSYFPGGTSGEESPSDKSRDLRNGGSIPGLGRFPGGVHGNLFQYSCLENSMGHGV